MGQLPFFVTFTKVTPQVNYRAYDITAGALFYGLSDSFTIRTLPPQAGIGIALEVPM
jgi:hypothetical protein